MFHLAAAEQYYGRLYWKLFKKVQIVTDQNLQHISDHVKVGGCCAKNLRLGQAGA
jgi:type IV secretory pathway protease TraF